MVTNPVDEEHGQLVPATTKAVSLSRTTAFLEGPTREVCLRSSNVPEAQWFVGHREGRMSRFAGDVELLLEKRTGRTKQTG